MDTSPTLWKLLQYLLLFIWWIVQPMQSKDDLPLIHAAPMPCHITGLTRVQSTRADSYSHRKWRQASTHDTVSVRVSLVHLGGQIIVQVFLDHAQHQAARCSTDLADLYLHTSNCHTGSKTAAPHTGWASKYRCLLEKEGILQFYLPYPGVDVPMRILR